MKITILMDNYSDRDSRLVAEHGFSCLIETPQAKVLFDTGQTGAFIRNAELLEKDLSDIDAIVISHGHYDHTGGLKPLSEHVGLHSISLWTRAGFFDKKYSKSDGSVHYRGPDFSEVGLKDMHLVHKVVHCPVLEIFPNIYAVGMFERRFELEQPNPHFLVQRNASMQIDDFSDEIMLVVDSGASLTVLVGCSHPGILNMVEAVLERFDKPIGALIGGIHLNKASLEHIQQVIGCLIEKNISMLGLSHCSGDLTLEILQQHAGTFIKQSVGSVFEA